MPDSIIFDLDGTLWSCLDTCVEAWKQALKAKGVDIVVSRQLLQSIMGLPQDKIAQKIFPFLTYSKKREVMEEISAREITLIKQKGGKLYKNSKVVLKKLLLAHKKLFIVSNSQKGYIEAFLDYYELGNPIIIDFESSGNTGKGKADNIKSIMKRNKLLHPVYIGDTVDDLKACEEVGIPFIYANYGFGKDVKSSYQISDIGDLVNTNILMQFD